MIDYPVTLTPSGGVVLPGHASALALGYTKNKGVYRLRITASGEWEGLTIRACWHLPGGGAPASTLVQNGTMGVPASVTAQPGQHYWGVALADGTYMVYEAGTVPPPPTAEELAAKEAERKKAEEREKLPETVAALQKENEMLKQCLLEMSETVYA